MYLIVKGCKPMKVKKVVETGCLCFNVHTTRHWKPKELRAFFRDKVNVVGFWPKKKDAFGIAAYAETVRVVDKLPKKRGKNA